MPGTEYPPTSRLAKSLIPASMLAVFALQRIGCLDRQTGLADSPGSRKRH